MDMIENHFEQMALSATSIAELPFPPPKMFTNALLQPHDITALIRDTEVHERALFTAAVPESSSRKSIAPGTVQSDSLANLKPNTAVGRILGSDLQRRIRRSERARGDADVELLLEGAEKLCAAYPIPGVLGRIEAMRVRHEKLASSIATYEKKIAEQASELQMHSNNKTDLDEDLIASVVPASSSTPAVLSLEEEEAQLRELEQKKQGLEDRVTGLDRDLGGLRS